MTIPLTLLAAPAVLFLAACAVPGMSGAAPESAVKPADAPFDCALTATRNGDAVEVSAGLQASRAFSGTYRLSLGRSGGGNTATIDQGGDFVAASGERLDLGQISLSGPATLTGALTVDWEGGTVTCPLTGL